MRVLLATPLLLAGCHSTPSGTNPRPNATGAQSVSTYPTRPTIPAPAVKVFHHTDTSITLVTDPNATDQQIESLVWQLRDAAHTHTLAKVGINQAFVDKNKSTWFHIYRGPRCAAEKYAPGNPPCGPSYHAAADYTLGTPGNPLWDNGLLLTPRPGSDDPTETPLWNADAPYTPTNHQPLTTYHLPLTTYHLPLTTYHLKDAPYLRSPRSRQARRAHARRLPLSPSQHQYRLADRG